MQKSTKILYEYSKLPKDIKKYKNPWEHTFSQQLKFSLYITQRGATSCDNIFEAIQFQT